MNVQVKDLAEGITLIDTILLQEVKQVIRVICDSDNRTVYY